jgi:hypothetical protein
MLWLLWHPHDATMSMHMSWQPSLELASHQLVNPVRIIGVALPAFPA